jgi:hypothetical protein
MVPPKWLGDLALRIERQVHKHVCAELRPEIFHTYPGLKTDLDFDLVERCHKTLIKEHRGIVERGWTPEQQVAALVQLSETLAATIEAAGEIQH